MKLTEKETKMNLKNFLKCEKVRCVDSENTDLTYGNEYPVLALRLRLTDDNGVDWNYDYDHFEPVLETAIQATDSLDDTPMGTRTVNEFEVGDRVYMPMFTKKIVKINECDSRSLRIETDNDDHSVTLDGRYSNRCITPAIFHATPENYEMLCKLYPHIEFEAPPKELTGSDLCRALLDKGWKYVPCYVDDGSDDYAIQNKEIQLVISCSRKLFFTSHLSWLYAVPFDPKTGKPLTSEAIND